MINKHKSNKIKENSNTVRHFNNGTDHRHSKSCCDQSSPARRTMTTHLECPGVNFNTSVLIHTYMFVLLISMLWHRKTIFESKGDNFSSSAECSIRTQRVSGTESQQTEPPGHKLDDHCTYRWTSIDMCSNSKWFISMKLHYIYMLYISIL